MPDNERGVSVIHGASLAEEPGIGSLAIGGYLREITQAFSDREAVVFTEGGREIRWTYEALWLQSVRLARALAAAGVVKGTRVGLLMTNRTEFLSAFFGTALAGGIAVPLSTFSTPEELTYLLQASCCSLVLFESRVLKKNFASILTRMDLTPGSGNPPEIRSRRFPFLRRLISVDSDTGAGGFEGWKGFLEQGETVAPEFIEATAASVSPSDPAAIFFSSGSTARPKGILSAHRSVALQFWRWPRLFGLNRDVRCWTANGFFWTGTFSSAIGGALSSGGTLVLQRTFQPQEALALMEKERVNFPLAWPHQWAQLEDTPNWRTADLSAMRYVNPKSPIARHPTVDVDWDEPVHAYGNSETFTISSICPSGTPEEVHRNSRGFPLPGNIFRILDPSSGGTVPVGERGEIAVKGPTLMLGYLGLPLDETLDDQGFLRTGDGGYVDEDGRLYWEGRLNDIIKTGGANVSPLEVDAVLATIPGVKVGQTVGVPHETLGEMVVACIVTQQDVVLNEAWVKGVLKEKLASYKVPRRVLFLTEEDIRTTASAKIKTSELRNIVASKLAPTGAVEP